MKKINAVVVETREYWVEMEIEDSEAASAEEIVLESYVENSYKDEFRECYVDWVEIAESKED